MLWYMSGNGASVDRFIVTVLRPVNRERSCHGEMKCNVLLPQVNFWFTVYNTLIFSLFMIEEFFLGEKKVLWTTKAKTRQPMWIEFLSAAKLYSYLLKAETEGTFDSPGLPPVGGRRGLAGWGGCGVGGLMGVGGVGGGNSCFRGTPPLEAYRYIMWPTLTKGGQSRCEDHEITEEHIP